MSHWDVDDSEQLKVLGAALKFRRAELDEAKAELARLTALLEDRQGMAVVVFQEMMHYSPENFLLRSVAEFKAAERIADRLIAYLKPLG